MIKKKLILFICLLSVFIFSPLYGSKLRSADSYSYDQMRNFYENFEDMLILDFSFKSLDSNINIDQSYVDFYTICSDIGKPNKKELNLSLSIYHQEKKNFESSLDFFVNEYYKFLDDDEIANLHLEFLSSIILSSFKIKIFGFCIQDMDKAKNFVTKELDSNDIFNSIILNHKLKTNINIFENDNTNFKERVFLKSNEKVLALLSIKGLFSTINSSNLEMIKRILKSKRKGNEKIIIDWENTMP